MLLPIEGAIADTDLLLPLLRDDEPLLRRRALAALAASRPWSERCGELATDLLEDPDPGVCAAAVEAFRKNPDQVALSRIALQEARAAAATPALAATITEMLRR
jgi:HEAT repeat protein